ncbi:uncharacterized protein LOC125210067 [Salvia hispanica]|uniref:uncharacterized protein LOC125210067 n=1 Tax=Salvia hispanica TaxID=49212 RepID=UPI002009A383|nr:uncharacterized protein LOC125210067 [Salvia hispanica]
MKSSIIVHVLSLLCCGVTLTMSSVSMSRTNCDPKCGKVPIPFPFGIGSKCSANSSFTVICRNSTTPFLSSINMEVLNISIKGTVIVKQPVPSPMDCSATLATGHLPISLNESLFTISARFNTLAVSGCKNSVWLQANETTTIGGCTSMCPANSTETSCNGVNCCQITLPPRLKGLEYTYKTNEATNGNSSCGFVLPVEKTWLTSHYKSFKALARGIGFAPLVLEWEFGELKGYTNSMCTYADDYCLSRPDEFGRRHEIGDNPSCWLRHLHDECRFYPSNYYCNSTDVSYLYILERDNKEYYSVYYDDDGYASSTKYCSCPRGFEGNPYLPEECRDINECSDATYDRCEPYVCNNIMGGYECIDQNAKYKARVKKAFISVGSSLGALILLLVAWRSAKAIKKRIKANRRRKFFKRNGGLLLEQQLSATDNGLDKTRLYSSKELTLATDNFNENRILGRGGQGTVYKGMLKDGKIVAVKKSQKLEEGDLEVFINEVVILSQVNHRNVVKLLGCCLETEVPLLVYEFIPNGTLYQHIHEPSEEFPLTWEMRMRIAREVAGSLDYLHSAASAPIYHRDIKSKNILLDEKYRAKVSDFGTSRSVSLDQTHCTTRVLGTFGYLDPEYFQSSQFTEKSDVYSFGVVMVELLTGEKAVTATRAVEGWGLASHFLHSMEENVLFEILDARVLKEGKRDEIMAVAQLARRCLNLNGKSRPTMKEVATELYAIKGVEECSYAEDRDDGGSREFHPLSIELPESISFSSITPLSPEAEYPFLELTQIGTTAQQLSATDNGLNNVRLYSSKELTLATDHFNENRILGRGGQGTVYKGMLKDGKIVAVKKSQEVEEGDLQVFINEMVILSQVNHRNAVKLLGCCLETEVPLLVYEYIPNGTLFQHIHEPSEEFPLTWEMRMTIAREVAGALAYLYSSAYSPIYHRDIKSTNILLDDKYRAKVVDFGTSRSVAPDQTHFTTCVVGTFGYLDPDFGVVMVELLTGEKAVTATRAVEGWGLASHFLHSMEENVLFQILDARVLKEGKRDEIMAVAPLARRCLNLNGKKRPTMKEVAAELEATRKVEECSYVEDRDGGSREFHSLSIELPESISFSSITPFSPEAEYPFLDCLNSTRISQEGRMKSSIIVHVLSLLCCGVTLTMSSVSMSRPNCDPKCGNVNITFPFGIGYKCSENSSFTIVCQNSTTPILSSINMEVLNISIKGTLIVNHPVSSPMNCSTDLNTGRLPISLNGSPFTISARYNTLAVSGCKNSIWLQANETTTVGECTSLCAANAIETSCNGVNCCQTTVPPRLKELEYKYKTTQASNDDSSSCGYVVLVEKEWLTNHYKSFKTLGRELGFAPVVLEWEFGELQGYTNSVCTYANDHCLSRPDDFGRRYENDSSWSCYRRHLDDECRMYPNGFRYYCQSSSSEIHQLSYNRYYVELFSIYYPSDGYASSTKYCSCPSGYDGNPYLPDQCIDIDECMRNSTENLCGKYYCNNVRGDYECIDEKAKYRARLRKAFIILGSCLGAVILLLVVWRSTKAIRKRIEANRRHKLFKRNGGLLLEQQLSATDNGLDNTKLYSSKELTLATDHYNQNRVLGRGGQGTVYKGMLKDGKIVAVKKSQKVEEGDLQVFINEVVILSQVNHRNVVKLLGCCLETEVPLLVYEFIPNGTLYQHIHEPSEEFPLTWEMRMRIAREVAGALAYLHSSASSPIYHRDIKSTNILLDDKYRAKVSDFGTSRSVSLDQTHCTTQVLGTFGYLDPEYFQSSQFTEKSDVYSFGVVMVELLTGEKAVTAIRAREGRGLATHFLHSMEENMLFEILDARVLREGKRNEIMAVAQLARRCLHLNGKRRPTMKEVAAELEGIKKVEECSYAEEREGGSREFQPLSIEVAESISFSSITPFSPEAEYPLLG